jgi:hypothetical protein
MKNKFARNCVFEPVGVFEQGNRYTGTEQVKVLLLADENRHQRPTFL